MGKADRGKRASLVRRVGDRPQRLPDEGIDERRSWLHWIHDRDKPKFRCEEEVDRWRGRECGEVFDTQVKLTNHQKRAHPYFWHEPKTTQDECTCPLCGYCPGRTVEKPRSGLRNHERKVHKIYARPYVIQEEP